MTTTIEKWLRDLLLPDDEVDRYGNWGFTVYRTDYGPSSEQQWQQLLSTIQTCAYKGTLSVTESTKDDPGFQHL
jgi:hypothetical protein